MAHFLMLAFKSEKQAVSTIRRALGVDDDEDGLPAGAAVSHIGPIEVTPAIYAGDGMVKVPALLDLRHHVNVLTGDDDAAEALTAHDSGVDNRRRFAT